MSPLSPTIPVLLRSSSVLVLRTANPPTSPSNTASYAYILRDGDRYAGGPRSATDSRGTLFGLVRTTQFLKRVSNFRNASRKGDSPNRPSAIARAARSMDLGSKVETKLEVRPHHSFDQCGDSGEDSPSRLSLRGSLNPNRASSSTTDSRIAPPLHQIDGLPRTTYRFLAPTTTTAPASITSHTRSQTLPSAIPTEAAIPPHNAYAHSHSTIGPSGRRALAPRLATLPPPLMAQYTAGGSARLTPSWVTRQPPMPLLNLPTLPPPTPTPPQPARTSRPTAPLRSLPALPMQGPSDTAQDGDPEDVSVEDEDEEEDGDNHAVAEGAGPEGDSDESEDDTSIPSASSVAGPSHIPGLPEVDTSRFSVSFGGSSSSRTPQASPPAGPSIDYFTSKPPEVEPPDRTPRPSDFRTNGKARAVPERSVPLPRIVSLPQPRIVSMPLPGTSSAGAASRPNLYHHASKSMVDLMSLTRKNKDKVYSPRLGPASPKITQDPVSISAPATGTATTTAADAVATHKPDVAGATEPPESEPDDVIQSSMLRRRRSLPVYEPSSDPPPYPDPLFRRRGQGVGLGIEEEGMERLPGYSNAIYLAGIMPRKMEFMAPGIQARDRKWRRVYCVLEGTAFRVFKCPPAASRVGALEQWWERKVGAGDFTSVDVRAVTASGVRVSAIRERGRVGEEEEEAPERIPKIVEEPAQARTPEPQQEPGRQREREVPTPSASSPPVTKSRFGLSSRFLHRQRSKSSSRTLSTLSASANESMGSSVRLSMDSRVSEGSRRPSHSTTRRSMDIVETPRTSVASSSNTHGTACTGLTVPATSTSGSESIPNERLSRRRSFLSQATSGSSGPGDGPPDKTDRAKGKEKEKDQGGYMPDAQKDLLHQYSLQNAESGLASDYQKRKNVIRVRMEGQQFLLQTKHVAAVIDWIEVNFALDGSGGETSED
ncbi:hypothetical protein GSI_14598 [Ganoderma sinense ZZ0214-1]|uniref:PH domain-containing protein n=1 Tax=Ganoderma sinense ZZ0214-1 TaxID=1077348 RepID=A0A2G8RPM3_9APHY|nr:hypothetical protein GSI_14598 [Ganoderma sinense ZZ0214-1]